MFDTGGISIKPAGGMEDMKGDMGGAAAVVGAMHAIAKRKAKANVVGIIGLVENMPDGKAQRPGDIVTSKSGQTVEIINTDAEGRLVLGDLLTYTSSATIRWSTIDLATLTGAVIVALGHYHAGMYPTTTPSPRSSRPPAMATGDQVWRMPLGKDYDGLIDSKVADMKNTGGRTAGSITAAQFLKRFVGEATWATSISRVPRWAPRTTRSAARSAPVGAGAGASAVLDRFIADNHAVEITMKLYTSKTLSPFGRTVSIVADELGLTEDIEAIDTTVKPTEPNTEFQALNPLRKIPALDTRRRTVLADSPVIVEYLCARVGDTRLLGRGTRERVDDPREVRARPRGDRGGGVRPLRDRGATGRQAWDAWVADLMDKVGAVLPDVRQNLPEAAGRLTIVDISLAALLGYLDFRYPDPRLAGALALAEWLTPLEERPSFEATKPA